MKELDSLITEAFLSQALFKVPVEKVIIDLVDQYEPEELAAIIVGLQALEVRRFIKEHPDRFEDISKYDRPTTH